MTRTSILQIHQEPLPGGPTGAGGGRVAACADTVSAAPTSPPGGVLSHVYRLPLRVPWTGQPGHTTGLERLGFYGDTLAALRAGPRAALRAGPRAARRAGPQAAQLSDQPQRHRAAGPSGQWTDGADTYQWTSRPRAPGARSWSHEPPLLGSDSDSADWSLHTAGPDNPDSATRLHLLGPAAIGSGPGRRRRSGVGQSGMDRAEGGDYS
jgi:hypothetical protein